MRRDAKIKEISLSSSLSFLLLTNFYAIIGCERPVRRSTSSAQKPSKHKPPRQKSKQKAQDDRQYQPS
jgi:hypothetical protein